MNDSNRTLTKAAVFVPGDEDVIRHCVYMLMMPSEKSPGTYGVYTFRFNRAPMPTEQPDGILTSAGTFVGLALNFPHLVVTGVRNRKAYRMQSPPRQIQKFFPVNALYINTAFPQETSVRRMNAWLTTARLIYLKPIIEEELRTWITEVNGGIA